MNALRRIVLTCFNSEGGLEVEVGCPIWTSTTKHGSKGRTDAATDVKPILNRQKLAENNI